MFTADANLPGIIHESYKLQTSVSFSVTQIFS